MISLTINGQTLEVPAGTTVLQAAEAVGITIPTLCYHKDLSPFGGCRLCVVEVQGARLPMTSCNLPINPGMVVQTESENLTRYRRAVLRMLLSNYYDAGYKRYNGKTGIEQDSDLAHWARVYEVDILSAMSKKPLHPVDSDPNPFVWVDMNKCIQCTRCVRACAEIQGRFVWSQAYRGYKARIVAGADSTMLQSRCESCGACVVYCPTGALDNKMSVNKGRADRLVQTTCAYCGVGCQFDLNVKDDVPGGRVIRVTSHSDASSPSYNGLHLCLKGRYGYEFIHQADRLTRPRVRKYLLEHTQRPKDRGPWVTVDWETALGIVANGLRTVRDQHGPQRIGMLASGKLLNEENYLLNKLARQVIGTNNLDCSAHVHRESLVEGLMESLGIPAMSNSLDDIAQHAKSLLVIGSNLTEQHPVFGARIRQAVMRRKVKMVVAHPDFINIAEYAALQLNHRPGSEIALLNGLMHIILNKGWQDHAFIDSRTRGFAEFKAVVDQFPPERAAEITGVPVEALYQAAEILAQNRPMAVLYSVGIADHALGRRNVLSLANLQMLLGNLDVPGGGVNPLRDQNNIQGASDMGCLPDVLPGYQPVNSSDAAHPFEQAWGTRLPSQPGLSALEMVSEAGKGGLKALYILGEDLIAASEEGKYVRRCLEACDLVVLQEIMASDTDKYADVLLPGVSFAEKTGTFTSAERRVQLVRQAIQPLGEAWPDWQIIADLARRILAGSGQKPAQGQYFGWDYADTAQVMAEIAALTPIYAGVSHKRLEGKEQLQWPVEAPGQPGTELLRVGYFTGAPARFTPVDYMPEDEEAEAAFI